MILSIQEQRTASTSRQTKFGIFFYHLDKKDMFGVYELVMTWRIIMAACCLKELLRNAQDSDFLFEDVYNWKYLEWSTVKLSCPKFDKYQYTSDCAILYNDRSVLENHHVSAVYRIMQDDEMNIFVNLTKDEFTELRALVIEMVLATDMSCHFQQVKTMKTGLQTMEK
ncbi:unnamed protein product [Ranitomeya imitator]|uniref:PDEase domain-containing protein n=1 Tax=Ranitomeya imitator TaxID=111125 RepID=A0ABN9LJ87_9NEOB|nr:unnamed protein product [Ranitomeya imitator]